MSVRGPALVVIQARVSSTRLPGKALLPLAGVPTALLCAQRAGRGGLRVRVAVSSAASDDQLAALLVAAGVDCVRGPLQDVLARFVLAIGDLPDDTAVVRLTADNPFPDDAFLRDLLADFEHPDVDYLGTHSPQDGLPYGLSAEVFSAGVLRRAAAIATSEADREHVTPWIRRHARAGMYQRHDVQTHWSRLRCTIDTFDDYLAMAGVFARCEDPVGTDWHDLLPQLAAATVGGTRPRCPFRVATDGSVHSALTLGSAQFGMPYGIANTAGSPDDATLQQLLTAAVDAGITGIDTARAYGVAEQRLGTALSSIGPDRVQVVTKLDVLADRAEDCSPAVVRTAVDASVFRSLHALGRRRIDTLLLHRWSHRHAWGGAAWQRLLALRDGGFIQRLGASVSTVQDAIDALAQPEVTHLQCPVNVLDHRWRSAPFLAAVRARPDVVVHARSVLLQGLLSLPATAWPKVPGVDASDIVRRLDDLVANLRRRDRLDLCLAYVRSCDWVTSLVVGMETAQQLNDNLAWLQLPALTADEARRVEQALPELPIELLDPARWPRA